MNMDYKQLTRTTRQYCMGGAIKKFAPIIGSRGHSKPIKIKKWRFSSVILRARQGVLVKFLRQIHFQVKLNNNIRHSNYSNTLMSNLDCKRETWINIYILYKFFYENRFS